MARTSRLIWAGTSPTIGGDIDHPEDWETNYCFALKHGEGRLFSVYRDRKGVKFWIITEADRSATTVLLPEDY